MTTRVNVNIKTPKLILKKSKVTSWKCGKPRHLKKDCKGGKVDNKANGSGTNGSVNNSLKGQNIFNKSIQNYYVTYASEAYFMKDDDVAWWVDSGATVHVCKDRCWFKTYESLNDGSILYMGNESTALVHRRGCVDLSAIEPNESVSINSIIESRDAIFDENRFSSVPRPSLKIPNGTEDIGGSVVPKEATDEIIQQPKPELKKRKRNRTPKNFKLEFKLYLIEGTMDEVSDQNSYCFNVEDDLKIFDEAMKSCCKPLCCKWIFKRKLKVYGTIEKFKARLVVQGFRQNLIIHQIDVKTTFLNGELEEEFYMNQPQGFIMYDNENKVLYGIAISQSYYIEKVLKKFNYFDCTPVSIPVDTSLILAFTIGKLSMYNSNPGTQHWQAIQRVLKYLKKTMDYSLIYTGYPSILEGYTDSSWISNTKDNSSTSGWVFLLGGGEISWASKRKTCIIGSTMEYEFVNFRTVCCDSAATLTKAYSQMSNGKSRHLGVRHNMIHELITNGVVSIEFMRSQQNLDDHLT
ncbi:zinc finger, CCHC-type containing protein [Tanacetum coccineum]